MSILRKEKADWVKVLEAMYENRMAYEQSEANIGEKFGAAIGNLMLLDEEVESSQEDVQDAIEFMQSVGLVKSESAPYSLTQDGLQLAHQIKTERQRKTTNIILVVLTAVLTVLTIGLFVVEILPLL